jgi:glutamine phosphoribosylpyrophosphate amidotransferase
MDNLDFHENDKFHDECGIFGVYAPGREVARLTFFGLYALQHRGQESAGHCHLRRPFRLQPQRHGARLAGV